MSRESSEKAKDDRMKCLPENVGRNGWGVQIVKEMVQKVKSCCCESFASEGGRAFLFW